MRFLKRLFGRGEEGEYHDPHGLHFHVQCDNCGAVVRLRADKRYDLERSGGGFVWHKTIVDSRCFRPMPAVVTMDGNYNVIEQEIAGGRFVGDEEE